MTGDEYPKWITAPGGAACIVPDAPTEAAVLAGEAKVPTPIRSATNHHLPIVPSVGAPPTAPAARRKRGSKTDTEE